MRDGTGTRHRHRGEGTVQARGQNITAGRVPANPATNHHARAPSRASTSPTRKIEPADADRRRRASTRRSSAAPAIRLAPPRPATPGPARHVGDGASGGIARSWSRRGQDERRRDGQERRQHARHVLVPHDREDDRQARRVRLRAGRTPAPRRRPGCAPRRAAPPGPRRVATQVEPARPARPGQRRRRSPAGGHGEARVSPSSSSSRTATMALSHLVPAAQRQPQRP